MFVVCTVEYALASDSAAVPSDRQISVHLPFRMIVDFLLTAFNVFKPYTHIEYVSEFWGIFSDTQPAVVKMH